MNLDGKAAIFVVYPTYLHRILSLMHRYCYLRVEARIGITEIFKERRKKKEGFR